MPIIDTQILSLSHRPKEIEEGLFSRLASFLILAWFLADIPDANIKVSSLPIFCPLLLACDSLRMTAAISEGSFGEHARYLVMDST